jgi:signal transduction histidine kinase
LNELEELIHGSHFEISAALSDLIVFMNRELADILITNLLTNAIHHTKEDKKIMLFVKANCFRITNKGGKRLNEKMIFDRFAKADSSGGSGLGLAIARQICELYGFILSYDFIEGSHHFQVNFKN